MNAFESESLKIDCAGEALLLHPERAIYWPAQQTLFVADVHAGKEHTFGRHGIAIPDGISDQSLHRLFKLCDKAEARHLTVLGDFMHTAPHYDEKWLTSLSTLLDNHPQLSMSIVAGNHDKVEGRSIIDGRVSWFDNVKLQPPFVLRHDPGDDSRGFVLCGHLHPTWRISHTRRTGLRAPIFWVRKNHAVLPAFGGFTGGVNIVPDVRHDRVFMTGSDCVVEIPLRTQHRRYRSDIPY
ncbi:MAG: ligase-associated DNA damage response endonuclease PdeM [Granulosicoccus sp.]